MTRKSAPKAKPKPKRKSDPAQYARFLETARDVGADEKPEAFDKAFKRVAGGPSNKKTRRE